MPKKSKKSKSKRLTLKDKHKIIKKVKEHHRKQRKEAKKLNKRKASLLKDPGIPANYPYREQLVKELKFEQARIAAKEAQKREARKERRLAKANGAAQEGDDDDDMGVSAQDGLRVLTEAAQRSQAGFDDRTASGAAAESSVGESAQRGKRAFYKEFKSLVSLADVVLEVLDARDPSSCRSLEIERYIRSVDPNKKIILVLNKIDLVPRDVASGWLKYYRSELPAVAFKAATKKSGSIQQGQLPSMRATRSGHSAPKQGSDAVHSTSECLGADTLLQLLKNYCRNAGMKSAVTVGVVGMPNVGKSSVINSLKRAKVAQVGNTPGVTRSIQEVHLDKHIKLVDSPGVVFASDEDAAAAALRRCVKVEQLEEPVAPVAEIVRRIPAKRLMHLYRIGAFDGAEDMLRQIAAARGKLRKGGLVDVAAAARIVLLDWNDGRIPFFTRPPQRQESAHEASAVVSAYDADFDAETVYGREASAVIAGLAEDSTRFVEAAAASAVQVDVAGLSANDEEKDNGGDLDDADMSDQEDMHDEPDARADSARHAERRREDAVLYGEEGQFNPKAARAARKAARKRKVRSAEAYSFEQDWGREDRMET